MNAWDVFGGKKIYLKKKKNKNDENIYTRY